VRFFERDISICTAMRAVVSGLMYVMHYHHPHFASPLMILQYLVSPFVSHPVSALKVYCTTHTTIRSVDRIQTWRSIASFLSLQQVSFLLKKKTFWLKKRTQSSLQYLDIRWLDATVTWQTSGAHITPNDCQVTVSNLTFSNFGVCLLYHVELNRETKIIYFVTRICVWS
jgi:hypothetical protein